MCGQQRNSPMADPIFGSKYGPQNGVQNWITFSFLLLSLCLGPVLGSRFGPKSGVSHRRLLLLPAEVLQADLRRTSMSVSVNTYFFSLCVPLCFLYSRGPFLAEGYRPSKPLLGSASRTSSLTHQDRPRNQVNHSQSSATFTTHTQTKRNVLLMSLWFLLTCHSLTQNKCCGVAS